MNNVSLLRHFQISTLYQYVSVSDSLLRSVDKIIAPQAPLEESATTEASRRCSLNGMLNGIRGSFWGRVLEAFATSISILAVKNESPELLRIGWILSVCVCACVSGCSLFFQAAFWTSLSKNSTLIS